MSRIPNKRGTVAHALPKVRHTANQGSNYITAIKRNLKDPQEFFDWMTQDNGMVWDLLKIRHYKRPLHVSDLMDTNPYYFYVISSEKGYSVMIDRKKGIMRIYYANGGDELEEGADAGEFHVICF